MSGGTIGITSLDDAGDFNDKTDTWVQNKVLPDVLYHNEGKEISKNLILKTLDWKTSACYSSL